MGTLPPGLELRPELRSESHPGIPVTLFLDYNCPFCYLASHRLERLRERYKLDILWRFVESQPQNPAEGSPLAGLADLAGTGHDAAHGQAMTQTLQAMLADADLAWGGRTFATNTRQAILLAQMTLIMRPRDFLPLHRALFHGYFGQCRNIGDESVLREIAGTLGLDDVVQQAWGSSKAMEVVLSHVQAAQVLGITDLPTLLVANRPFSGAVSMDILEQALQAEHQA